MSEIEKQFFETFGIESKWGTVCNCCDCQEFEKAKSYNFDQGICCGCYHCTDGFYYPQITDNILLELISICVLYGWHLCRYWTGNQDFVYENQRLKPEERFCVIDIDLKNATLILLIELVNKESIKHQVQALFKDDN